MEPALIFPGQGAQFIGMGKDLSETFSEANEIFSQADELLDIPLSKYCFEGPAEALDATDVCQPAVFTHSAAVVEILRKQGWMDNNKPACVGGLSLGEYTALYAANTFDFASGLKLVRERGRRMQNAAEMSPSGMVAIAGLEKSQVEKLCEECSPGDEILSPANFNCPGQIVVSGHKQACERIQQKATEAGGQAMALSVAGAFHSPLMQPAADGLKKILEETEICQPSIPVISNVTAEFYDDADSIRKRLVEQLTNPTRWQDCMQKMVTEKKVENFYEIGPGRVLRGLLRRFDRKLSCTTVGTAQDVQKLI
jgi:[acyl-carrier-protein] S-malonyltransferase